LQPHHRGDLLFVGDVIASLLSNARTGMRPSGPSAASLGGLDV
jgi:hypothetical protein